MHCPGFWGNWKNAEKYETYLFCSFWQSFFFKENVFYNGPNQSLDIRTHARTSAAQHACMHACMARRRFQPIVQHNACMNRQRFRIMMHARCALLDIICPAKHMAQHRSHYKTYRARDSHLSMGVVMGAGTVDLPYLPVSHRCP